MTKNNFAVSNSLKCIRNFWKPILHSNGDLIVTKLYFRIKEIVLLWKKIKNSNTICKKIIPSIIKLIQVLVFRFNALKK